MSRSLCFVFVIEICLISLVTAGDGDLRLVGGRSKSEGNVYVQFGGRWGLVCDDGWNSRSASVVCKQLGYRRVIKVTKYNYYRTPVDDEIFLDDVQCVGREKRLAACRHRGRFQHDCGAKEAAGVACDHLTTRAPWRQLLSRGPRTSTTSATPTARRTTTTTPRPATPPPTRPPRTTAQPTTPRRRIADRYPFRRPQPGPAAAPTKSLQSSAHRNPARSNSLAPPPEKALTPSVKTMTPHIAPPLFTTGSHGPGASMIRSAQLMGGRSNKEGYVKVVLTNGASGTICSDSWGMKEGMVVCRELGQQYTYAERATKSDFFRGKRVKKVVHSVSCFGWENRLSECSVNVTTAANKCSRAQSVSGVICTDTLPDLIPNITALVESVNIQDRQLAYMTCALEENCLSSTAYELKSKYPRDWNRISRRLLRFSSSVSNEGTADFRPNQHRNSWEWHSCHMHFHSMDVFSHYDIYDYNGNKMAEGHKASFCLEDVVCHEGNRTKYSCDGEQGISVGCADVYKHDIDCQWIDITDMKAGQYIFKFKVNPNYLVGELSFDNNAAVCDLNYSGFDAKLLNCHLARD